MSERTPSQQIIARQISEKELSQWVYDLARMTGWLVHRVPTWRSTGTSPGFPDLFLVHPERYKAIAVELKAAKGKVTPSQLAWHDALSDACVHVEVWTPEMWLSGYIERFLTGER